MTGVMSASPKPTSRTGFSFSWRAGGVSPLLVSPGATGADPLARVPQPPLARTNASSTATPRRQRFMSRSFPGFFLTLPHVADALAGNRFGVGCVVEDLDRDPATVIAVQEGLEDRHEVHVAEAGATLVWIVGVEVARARHVMANDLRHWRSL